MGQPIPDWVLKQGVLDQTSQFAIVPVDVIDVLKDARALALYVILKRYAARDTGLAYPSRGHLATLMGYRSTKAVDEALGVLKEHGLVVTFARYRNAETGEISVEPREGFGRTSNGYILRDLRVESPAPKPPGGDTPIPDSDQPISPVGDNPHTLEGIAPMPYRGHYLYEDDLHEDELDISPLPPKGEPEPTARGEQEKTPASSKPNSRGEFLPEGWMPAQETIWQMQRQFPGFDLKAEHEVFTDYWRGISGAKGRKRDWDATWRNWMRRAASRPGKQAVEPTQGARYGTSAEDWLATLTQAGESA